MIETKIHLTDSDKYVQCPFCKNVNLFVRRFFKEPDVHFAVVCGECGMVAPREFTIENAINGWNRGLADHSKWILYPKYQEGFAIFERQTDNEGGWTIRLSFLKKIRDMLPSVGEHSSLDESEIENVLLATELVYFKPSETKVNCRSCIYFSEDNQKRDFSVCMRRLPHNYFNTIPGSISANDAIKIGDAIIGNPDIHSCNFFQTIRSPICDESI